MKTPGLGSVAGKQRCGMIACTMCLVFDQRTRSPGQWTSWQVISPQYVASTASCPACLRANTIRPPYRLWLYPNAKPPRVLRPGTCEVITARALSLRTEKLAMSMIPGASPTVSARWSLAADAGAPQDRVTANNALARATGRRDVQEIRSMGSVDHRDPRTGMAQTGHCGLSHLSGRSVILRRSPPISPGP